METERNLKRKDEQPDEQKKTLVTGPDKVVSLGNPRYDLLAIAKLLRRQGLTNFACLYDSFRFRIKKGVDKELVYFAGEGPAGNLPYSPVVNLLQSVYEETGSPGLGERVFLLYSGELDAMSEGMLKFLKIADAGGRLFYHSEQELESRHGQAVDQSQELYAFLENAYTGNTFVRCGRRKESGLDQFKADYEVPQSDGSPFGNNAPSPTVHRVYMMAAFALITKRFANAGKGDLDDGYNIGALLVDGSGKILAWGLNTSERNRVCHAEVNMVQSYFRFNQHATALPRGARIYTSLKPCLMCAGMIRAAAEDINSLRVYYGHFDKGSHAQNTALDASGVNFLLADTAHASQMIYGNVSTPRVATGTDETKSVKLYASTDNVTKTLRHDGPELSSALYTKSNEHKSVVQYLKEPPAKNLVNSARTQILRKVNKYKALPKDNLANHQPNTYLALQHVLAFVQARGLLTALKLN